MVTKYISIKQCADYAEAAFLANYLQENGIRVENSAEKMGAWTGRYSMLSRGPVLRVDPKDAARARKLLMNPPKVDEEALEALNKVCEQDWTFDEELRRCPLCGSENIVRIPEHLLLEWVVNMLTLGLCKLSGRPMWICRDCDWDSRRPRHMEP
ncbi:MAG: hypothetical protein BWX80_03347 [Candidatus Hydrogenedentes bacterium ADurb.Bin101]|jgi:hypothetical protein|nr:MAG: hypothetical protein BWX80_03347 [Candidatus Hydrogenedentes bacterium ADurb.Bin101]HOC67347.1 hypothetical protein [Candidatus Hydrogenedentota bacterium]